MTFQPIRVINGNTKPFEPFWNVISAKNSQSGEAEIEFFGPISEYSWWGDEVTPRKFKNDLYDVGQGGPVRVKINSTGGEVFAANSIRSILQDYPGKVTVDIVGVAASAATIVITGADTVEMREGATLMVHNPSALGYGYASDLRKVADSLDTIKEGILNIYVSKTGKDRQLLSDLMDGETWMAASEAKEYGFVDEVISGKKDKSSANIFQIPTNLVNGFVNCLKMFDSLPENLTAVLNTLETNPELPDPTNVPPAEQTSEQAADANALEVERLGDFLDIFS